jgi:hypothetical protein
MIFFWKTGTHPRIKSEGRLFSGSCSNNAGGPAERKERG